jgi:hypothetical protein
VRIDLLSRKDFTPISALVNRDGGHTVLLFITSFNIQHHDRSDDPIFLARHQITSDPTGNPDLDDLLNHWTNNEPHSSVLACAEHAILCRNDSVVRCYDPWDHGPPSAEFSDEELLTFWGLMYSGFWSTIKSRTSKELDATRKIVDISISMPLDPNQWKLEAKRIFEMQLVRARWEVLEIARGTRASMPDFANFLDEDKREVCQKVKFQSTGYKNLSLFGLLLGAILPPLLAFPLRKKKPLILWPYYLFRMIRSEDFSHWSVALKNSVAARKISSIIHDFSSTLQRIYRKGSE